MHNLAWQNFDSDFFSQHYRLSVTLLLSCCAHGLLLLLFVVAVGQNFQPFQVEQSMQLTLQSSSATPQASEVEAPVEAVIPLGVAEAEPEVIEAPVAYEEMEPVVQPVRADIQQSIETTSESVTAEPQLQPENTVTIEQSQDVMPEPVIDTVSDFSVSSEIVVIDDSDFQITTNDIPQDVSSVEVIDAPLEHQVLKQQLSEWLGNGDFQQSDMQALEWVNDGQVYEVSVEGQPPGSQLGLEKKWVKVSTEHNGQTVETRLELKRMAFSNYTQFLNKSEMTAGFGGVIAFHDDVIEGRFHSNAEIVVDYGRKTQPQFLGKVTTSARRVAILKKTGTARLSKNKRDQIFTGGIEMGVDKIDMPKSFVPFPYNANVEEKNIHRLNKDSQLVFDQGGGVTIVSKGAAARTVYLGDQPHYFFAEGKTTLEVKGVLKGKVLVYSPYKIKITGSLVYADRPDSLLANDYLGLVSDRNVTVAEPSVTGDQDIEIHAAIYAKSKFNVERYRTRSDKKLTIHGSISSGFPSPTEPRFSTHITFDGRFEKFRPPGFPMTERFELDSWDETWRVEEDENEHTF